MRKQEGEEKWLKESFRCRCDPAAEYFHVTAIRGGQAPVGHPPCITCDEASLCAMQSRNHPSLQMLLAQRDQQITEEKGSRILQTGLFFSSPSPRCCEPETLYSTRCVLLCQTPRQPWSALISAPGPYPQVSLTWQDSDTSRTSPATFTLAFSTAKHLLMCSTLPPRTCNLHQRWGFHWPHHCTDTNIFFFL